MRETCENLLAILQWIVPPNAAPTGATATTTTCPAEDSRQAPGRRRDQFAVVDAKARSRLVALFRELDRNVDGLITIDDVQDALLLVEESSPLSGSAPRVVRSQRTASMQNASLARRASM